MASPHPTPEYQAWAAALCARLEVRVTELRRDASRGAMNRCTALESVMADLRGRAAGGASAAPPRPATVPAAERADLFL